MTGKRTNRASWKQFVPPNFGNLPAMHFLMPVTIQSRYDIHPR